MTRKKSSKPAKPRDPAVTAMIRRVLLHTVFVIWFVGLIAGGVWFAREHVRKRLAFSEGAPKVVMVNRPAWMSEALAQQILAMAQPIGGHSAFDRQMLVDVAQTLTQCPWVKQVKQIRRVYGDAPGDTLEIDCDYRAPIALVHWKDFYWLVDGEGVKLPEQYTLEQLPRVALGKDRKMNIRVIEGVRNPPPESGQKWIGDDVVAGIDMAKFLYGRPFVDEIAQVDVSNFQGRRDSLQAHVVLVTKDNTEIRWGRPVGAKDHFQFLEISASQKLDTLRQVFEQYHRVDGNQAWIDIRFDKITYPNVMQAGASE